MRPLRIGWTACWLLACSTTRNNPTSAIDSGIGARVDAGTFDATTVADASPDAATWGGPIGADWVSMPGVPSTCSLRMAPNPGSEVSALHWQSCSSGRLGCKALQPDWAGWLSVPPFESPRLVNGVPMLLLYRTYAKSYLYPDALLEVVSTIDGPPIAAIGQLYSSTETCTGTGGIGDYGIAFSIVSGVSGAYFHWLRPASC